LYTKSKAVGVPGSERVLRSFITLIRSWISVERWFCDGRAYADAMDGLRKAFKDEPGTILHICRAHEQLSATSEVVSRIIVAVADGSRVDFDAVTPSAIGKRVSVVAGAAGLAEALPAIAEVGNMGSSDEYAELALRARKVVMHASMPSLDERRQKVLAATKALSASASAGPFQSREVEELLADHIPMVDVFFPLLKSVSSREEAVGLLELHVRHLFRPYTIKTLERDTMKRIVRFSFVNKPSESLINASTSVTSMTDLTRMVSSGSLAQLHESADLSESSQLASNCKEKIPDSMTRVGVEVIIDTLDDLLNKALVDSVLSKFPQFTSDTAAGSDLVPVNALYFVVLGPTVDLADTTQDDVALRCQTAISQYRASLTKAGVRRVSFVFDQEQQDDLQNYPALFTFRHPEYQEDSLYRRIDPSLAIHLDLNRFAANFRIRSLGSRHTTTCDVHVYEGVPRASALALDKTARRSPRTFARSLSFALEFSSSTFERILVDSLNAFDLWRTKSKSDNHLFLNLVSDYEKTVLDPVVVEQVVVAILKRHGERVSGLGIIEVEMRIVCCLSANTPPIAIRLFASNPTGYVHVMNTYVEAASQSGNERIFKLISGTKASLASAGDSSWDGLNVNTPYPLTRPFDAQRSAALRSSDTLYCYDLPALFEAAVEEQWVGTPGMSGVESGIRASARPLMVMYTQELVVEKKGGSNSESWTMADYLNGILELVPTSRGAGANDVGMVAWLVVLKTVEYPNVSTHSWSSDPTKF
jgi:acetyl-CoA carboxylase / biotin carboxylase 1